MILLPLVLSAFSHMMNSFKLSRMLILFGCCILSINQLSAIPDPKTDSLFNHLTDNCFADFSTIRTHADVLIGYTEQEKQWDKLIEAHVQAGVCLCAIDYIQEGFFYLRSADELLLQLEDEIRAEKEDLQMFLQVAWASGYSKAGDYMQSVESYQPIIRKYEEKINQGTFPSHSTETDIQLFENTFVNSGLNNIRVGEYEEALNLFQFFINNLPSSSRTGLIHKLTGDAYIRKKDYEMAEQQYLRAYEINRRYDPTDRLARNRFTITCLALAKLYAAYPQGSLKKSQTYLDEANTSFQSGRIEVNLYETSAKVYQAFEQYDVSASYYKRMMSLQEERYGAQSIQVAKVHRAIAMLQQEQDLYQPALQSYETAISILTEGLPQTNKKTIPESAQSRRELHATLIQYVKILKMTGESPLRMWEQSLWAQTLTDSLRLHYTFGEDQLALINDSYDMYEDALDILSQLEDRSDVESAGQAHRIMRKSKQMLLLESLKRAEASQEGIVSASLLSEERGLQLQIARLGHEMMTLKQKNPQDPKIAMKSTQLFGLQTLQSKILDSIQSQSQAYFDLRYGEDDFFSLLDLQQSLTKEQLLQEFFVGKAYIFVLVVDSSSAALKQIPITPELDQSILSMREMLSKPPRVNELDASYQQYVEHAHSLYEVLLEDILTTSSARQLIIIPDERLAYLPFEALLTERPTSGAAAFDHRQLSYLIEDYQISYAYSSEAFRLQQNGTGMRDPASLLVGFAPQYGGGANNQIASSRSSEKIPLNQRERLFALPFGQQELEAIGALFRPKDRKLFLEGNASEKNFRTYGPQASILHFSMHSLVNDSMPMFSALVFDQDTADTHLGENDGILYAYELFGIQLYGELGVLAACNMETGPYRPGQGLMSLAKAFAFSGCPSLVASLWEAEDHTTSIIMDRFYEYLIQSMSKDQALRKAKLSYLTTNGMEPISYHPFFWATFVQIGDSSSVKALDTRAWEWYLIGLFSIVILLGSMIIVRNRKQKTATKPA